MPLSESQREAHRLAMARYRAKYPDKELARSRKWREKNREKCAEASVRYKSDNLEQVRESGRETVRRRKAKDPEAYLAAAKERAKRYREKNPLYHIKRFGITPDQYSAMLANQGGVCAICQSGEKAKHGSTVRKLCVDHCHDTGVVRGLLCRDCNIGIGKLGHSSETLRRAADYLGKVT